MRVELQQIGTLCVALLLGGSVSLSLFFMMVFLIEPDRTTNSHIPRPYVVSFVAIEHQNKAKQPPDKNIKMPKLSRNLEPTSRRADALKKAKRKTISARLPNTDQINVYSTEKRNSLDLNIGAEENYYPKDDHRILFNQIERKYSRSKKGKTLPPERVRIPGGGEIDRIGNVCYEVSSVGDSGSGNTGQTAIEKDRSFAMRSFSAHQVPCNKTDRSLAKDFLKQLKKRGLIMAPVPATN